MSIFTPGIMALALMSSVAIAQSPSKWIFAEQDFVLTPHEQLVLKADALKGSTKAAARLTHFYMNVVLDLEEGLRWAIVGAENGDPVQQYEAYYLLSIRASEEDRQRAGFWLHQAAEQGYKPAIDELEHSASTVR
ncbi:hypothetical protein [Dyella silvatica]|uniref:hypothetical protein n=1 Tax=Dyella silvatica TaxID=2992128 RepID=UPI00224CD1E2|nr:hypothetical protein [Dyella silvatica]